MKLRLLILILILPFSSMFSQEKEFKISAVGFYNLENLFDIEDSENTNDTEFTPEGKRNWNKEKYEEKLMNMASVISELGTEMTRDGIAVLGISEVENRKVIEDLISQNELKSRQFGIVHEDSPDRRGIDVALIYRKDLFELVSYKYHTLLFFRDSSRVYTRDILHVSGKLDGELMHFMVNHWPSRSGGEKRSRPGRNAGATLCKAIADSIRMEQPDSKIIIMGDLNDDPISPSVKNILKARRNISNTPEGGFYNPMFSMFKNGIGSNAYRDAWSLFDQLIVSQSFLPRDQDGFFYYQTRIHNPDKLIQKSGRYKGYPFRTFSGDTYISGFSDHFPVYLYLLKEKN